MTNTTVKAPQNLIEAVIYFADKDRSFEFVKSLRWADGEVACPRCGAADPSFLTTRKIWKCKGCRRQFSIKVGTIFEDSPLGFEKWLPAFWLIANSKNSISSHELGRALNVTQRTAWFMLHRIRDAMEARSIAKLSGIVEVDETFVGGLAKNKHARLRHSDVPGKDRKIPVQGARQREGGLVHAEPLANINKWDMQNNIIGWVESGSAIYSDEATAYKGIDLYFAHKTVNHSTHEYVSGDVYTNGIENFWSILKRSIKGSQIHVDPVHLHRYVTERTFAYNFREDTDLTRMCNAVSGIGGRRLTWKQLTNY
jgi:transposase-like protein